MRFERQWAIEQAVQTDAAAWEITRVAQSFLDWVNKPADALEANDEGWVKWEGGECPVGKNVMVEAKFEDGSISCDHACAFSWDVGTIADILAYRVVNET